MWSHFPYIYVSGRAVGSAGLSDFVMPKEQVSKHNKGRKFPDPAYLEDSNDPLTSAHIKRSDQ